MPSIWQPPPQGLFLAQNGGRRNPWPRLLKYSTNRRVFCHVTHDEMAFSEVDFSVWRPRLFSAIGNRYSNKTKTFHRVCEKKWGEALACGSCSPYTSFVLSSLPCVLYHRTKHGFGFFICYL